MPDAATSTRKKRLLKFGPKNKRRKSAATIQKQEAGRAARELVRQEKQAIRASARSDKAGARNVKLYDACVVRCGTKRSLRHGSTRRKSAPRAYRLRCAPGHHVTMANDRKKCTKYERVYSTQY